MSENSKSYDDLVREALQDVKIDKQHLRFINSLYRTKEICFEAVRFESTHTCMLSDFYSVPMENLDYVVDKMKELKKNDEYYLQQMEKAYKERKELERISGYYGEFKNYQQMLDYFGAIDYDDMIRKKFDNMCKTVG